MENLNNPDQQRVDQNSGGPLEGLSPQYVNMPGNDVDEENAIYSELGLDGRPDAMNLGDEEASDTILYTDNAVATDMTDRVFDTTLANSDLPAELYNEADNISEARLEAQMDMLDDEADDDRKAELG